MIMGTTPPLYQHNVSIVLKSTNVQMKGGIVLPPIYSTSNTPFTVEQYTSNLPASTCDGIISNPTMGSNGDELDRTWYKILKIGGYEDGHFYLTAIGLHKETYHPSKSSEILPCTSETLLLYRNTFDLYDQVTQIL